MSLGFGELAKTPLLSGQGSALLVKAAMAHLGRLLWSSVLQGRRPNKIRQYMTQKASRLSHLIWVLTQVQ